MHTPPDIPDTPENPVTFDQERGVWLCAGKRYIGVLIAVYVYRKSNPEHREEVMVFAANMQTAAAAAKLIHPDLEVDESQVQRVAIMDPSQMTRAELTEIPINEEDLPPPGTLLS